MITFKLFMKWKFFAYLLWPLGKSVKINKCRAFIYSEYKKMYRGKINGKAGKAAALPKFSGTLTLSQLGRGGAHCDEQKAASGHASIKLGI